MHLYMMTRGIKHEVDEFINQLSAKYLPFKFRRQDIGEKELKPYNVQVAVRPIQLWEIVFPEEHKDLVLSTCLSPHASGSKGKTQHSKHEKFIWAIRKMLGVEPIPEFDNKTSMPIRCEGIELIGIGIKPDKWVDKDGKTIDKKEEGAFEAL